MNYKILQRGLMVLVCSLFFYSCNDKDETTPLSQIVANNYWEEEIYFVYKQDGDLRVTDNNIVEEFGKSGGYGYHPYIKQLLLKMIHVDSETGGLWQYVFNKDKVLWDTYYSGRYSIVFDESNRIVRVKSTDPDLIEKNALVGSDMKLISMTEEELIFEAPIKAFIREHWHLELFDGSDKMYPKRDYLNLRVVWRKITDQEVVKELKAAQPID